MENVVIKQMTHEEQIHYLLGMLDDNLKLYPEYSDKEKFKQCYLANEKNFCDNIATIIFKQMDYEADIDYHYIIGVYIYLKLENPELTFYDIINKMFDKTNNITKIKKYMTNI